MPKVSVIINTLNEEEQIKGCVESVRWADQIVVVDMFSDDSTAQIAAKLGCEVHSHKREGYVEPARAFAVSKALHPWVLILDADERCSDALSRWIQSELSSQKSSAFRIPRRNYLHKSWLKCCGWYPDSQLRLLLKDKATFSNIIHRAPQIEGDVFDIPSGGELCLHHLAVPSLNNRFEKLVRYGQIAADSLAGRGKTISGAGLFLRVFWSFFSAYFLKAGFLNGTLGVVLSLDRAMATFIKYAFVWESSNRNDSTQTNLSEF
jgi:glycosyltransferase involved in cell wall biosynthesis